MKAEKKQIKRSLYHLFFPTTLSEIDSSSFCKDSPENSRIAESGVALNFQTRGVIISNFWKTRCDARRAWVELVLVASTLSGGNDRLRNGKLRRRRRLKSDINFNIWEKLYDELTNVFDTWSLFNDFNLTTTKLVCPGWRCIQNEDGVKLLKISYSLQLFCMKNAFVWETPSSRFAVVDLKVPIIS